MVEKPGHSDEPNRDRRTRPDRKRKTGRTLCVLIVQRTTPTFYYMQLNFHYVCVIGRWKNDLVDIGLKGGRQA